MCPDSRAPLCHPPALAVEPRPYLLTTTEWSTLIINWEADDSADFSLWPNPAASCVDLNASVVGRAHPLARKISSEPFRLFKWRLLLLSLHNFLNYLVLNLELLIYSHPILPRTAVCACSQYVSCRLYPLHQWHSWHLGPAF